MVFYVSKLGDNSDGSSWRTAFHTIQRALLAVPDDKGGHRIIVRPDTYCEANLYTEHKGAAGAYNQLIGDFDGRLGSGAKGWVVIDSGDPELGFKSYDWWSCIRAYSKGWSPEHNEESFSSVCFDRWYFRGLYFCGADGGLFFDGLGSTDPFSILAEDCVGIGRAFGAGAAGLLSRPDEPPTFRRCRFYALDYIGDTAAFYLRMENPSMPGSPDAILEDCVLIAPQACLKSTNYSLIPYTWSSLKRCTLIQLNFTQPEMAGTRGVPGIVTSVQRGDRMKVSFEDCTLMGYQAFGVLVETETVRDIVCETRGDCRIYQQFKQELPRGFRRLGKWPVEVFALLAPPNPDQTPTGR